MTYIHTGVHAPNNIQVSRTIMCVEVVNQSIGVVNAAPGQVSRVTCHFTVTLQILVQVTHIY